MDERSFCYWLQGFAELQASPPTPEQWRSIREHLAMVFTKVTPPVNFPQPTEPGIEPLDWDKFKRATMVDRLDGPTAFLC